MAPFKLMPIYKDVPNDMFSIMPISNDGGPNFGGGFTGGSRLRKFQPSYGVGGGEAFQMGPSASQGMFSEVFRNAMGGTTQSFDTAANRLRERIDAAGQSRKATSANGMKGLGASGIASRRADQIDQDSMFTYGQSLADLASQFEKFRLDGLGIANNAATGVAGWDRFSNELGQTDLSQRRSLANDAGMNADRLNFQGAEALDRMDSENALANRRFNFDKWSEILRDKREREISQNELQSSRNLSKNRDLSSLLQLLMGNL